MAKVNDKVLSKFVDDPEEECKETSKVPECAVCLQFCIHPAQLPCSHVFCFLCVKGVANQSKKCPLCRHEIPPDFLEKPQLLDIEESTKDDEEYQWFYEGRNGWWQYDQRTSVELENAFKQGTRTCELLIAGFLYIADFESMLQLRRNDPSRRRRIKRDLHNVPKKGVAGLRLNEQEEEFITREIRGAERTINLSIGSQGVEDVNAEILDNPQAVPDISVGTIENDSAPVSDRLLLRQQSETLHQVIEHMRSLVLGTSNSYNSNNELTESSSNRTVSGHNSPSRLQTSNTYFDEVPL